MNADERRLGEERKNFWPQMNADWEKKKRVFSRTLTQIGSGTKESIISIILGKHESRPDGATRPTPKNEPREFTSRGEGERVSHFMEKIPNLDSFVGHGNHEPYHLNNPGEA